MYKRKFMRIAIGCISLFMALCPMVSAEETVEEQYAEESVIQEESPPAEEIVQVPEESIPSPEETVPEETFPEETYPDNSETVNESQSMENNPVDSGELPVVDIEPEQVPDNTEGETETVEQPIPDITGTPEQPVPEAQPETESETEPETEQAPVENTVTIVGFSVDPSQYPPANINENTSEIYSYLTGEMGLNHAAACGVLGNVQCESDFDPRVIGDGGTSYGICQWHNERFNRLISYCNNNGLDYNTLYGQLLFLDWELNNVYPNVLSYIRQVPDTPQGAYDAAYYWCIHFEAPANMQAQGALRGNLAMNEFYGSMFAETVQDEEPVKSSDKDILKELRTKMDEDESQKEKSVNSFETLQNIRTLINNE